MASQAPIYDGYRFPAEIINHGVWLYHRSCLSFRNAEDLLAQRGITVSYGAIRQWCRTFGPEYARTLRRRRGRLGDTWHLDELFVNIQGRRQYFWRAVDQDGDVIDILVQPRRDQRAAERCFRELLKGQDREPRRLITDKLRSCSAAHRAVMPSVVHSTERYENNRAEVSHQPTRLGERAESLPGGPKPAAVGSPPFGPNASVHRMGCGDVRLLNESGSSASKGEERAVLINLTVPRSGVSRVSDRENVAGYSRFYGPHQNGVGSVGLGVSPLFGAPPSLWVGSKPPKVFPSLRLNVGFAW